MATSPPRHLKTRTDKGVLVLTINEPHLRGDNLVEAVRDELLAAVENARSPKVVLDFQPVASLSSEAFRPLLSLRNKVKGAGGKLVLCNLSPVVAKAFQATRMISTSRSSTATFPLQATVADAVASLKGEEEA